MRTRDFKGGVSFKNATKLEKPIIDDITYTWAPNDNRHNGIIYLHGLITGTPNYVEFGPRLNEDGQPVKEKWQKEMETAWAGLQRQFKSSAAFNRQREKEWTRFMEQYPWGGLKDLEGQDGGLPPFSIPEFSQPSTAAGRQLQKDMDDTGLDEYGIMRYKFREGKDVAVYKLLPSTVTFNGFLCGPRGSLVKKRPPPGQSLLTTGRKN